MSNLLCSMIYRSLWPKVINLGRRPPQLVRLFLDHLQRLVGPMFWSCFVIFAICWFSIAFDTLCFDTYCTYFAILFWTCWCKMLLTIDPGMKISNVALLCLLHLGTAFGNKPPAWEDVLNTDHRTTWSVHLPLKNSRALKSDIERGERMGTVLRNLKSMNLI